MEEQAEKGYGIKSIWVGYKVNKIDPLILLPVALTAC
jgi:hypothetical protein